MGIRFKIFITIAATLFLAMFLMCMVTVYIYHRVLVKIETEKGINVAKILVDFINQKEKPWVSSLTADFFSNIEDLLDTEDMFSIYMRSNDENLISQYGKNSEINQKTIMIGNRFINSGRMEITYFNYRMYLFVNIPNFYVVSLPIIERGEIIGVAAMAFPIRDAVGKIKALQEFLILYMIINTILFALIGGARVSRFVLRPMRKLIQRANDYRNGDTLLLPYEGGGSEWETLSRAMNRIVTLNINDNQKLSETVKSLQLAVDDLKKAQKEIIRTEKMATVGRLSSGIAHEIGNPIGIILGYLELIQKTSLSEKEKSDLISRIITEVKRIDIIIRQLLDFSRPGKDVISSVSVHEVLEEIIQMCSIQPLFTEIEITSSMRAETDMVLVDRNQLHQAVLNLILNAADAIKENKNKNEGKIDIRTNYIGENDNPCFKKAAVQIMFEDNGEGIPPELIDKIFDPFFTTKEPGKGTGLGLWVTILIIEGFGGKITVDSKIGEGTTMNIYLPAVEVTMAPFESDTGL